ncbi:hypothetical protein INP83_12285 [Mucilaginibacter sp. 21P]|uniref:hypothetical protein n=1 Tax=Mucilaginibacter sp. 21P TaxID=2778902 RepID=UPI001C56DBE0|nr:hypothetical protein [Mucilaginibacter sp. 21P]QXV63882.1 hypothetical protein INP83_12285 [Mucilaginibacter sp. 21P]
MSVLTTKKEIADRLAELICQGSDDMATMNKLADEISVSLKPEQLTSSMVLEDDLNAGFDNVGIWKRSVKQDGVYFMRDDQCKDDWAYWAQSPLIPPKSNKKRIAFLGESVARGYLFDPYYTPAQVLEKVLDDSGFIDAEVIDLARTNLDLNNLKLLTAECLELAPEGIVVFAGNNWFYSVKRGLGKADILEMGRKLEKDGLAGLKNFLQERFEKEIIKYLEQLSVVVNERKVPVWFIIPEFNLLDWKCSNNERILTALSNEKLNEFVEIRDKAEAALKAKNYVLAETLGRDLIDIDLSHPAGYEIVAESILAVGERVDQAREYLESARDTSIFSRAYSKPRMFNVVRKTLLANAEAYGIKLIDLPEVFKEAKDGNLAGRELFLDYCHLSEEGIQIAMAATAQSLIDTFKGIRINRELLGADKYVADADVRAIAYLCAAVHCAHYGQSHNVLNYLCDTAAEASTVAVDIMSNFIDFSSRRTTNTLCRSHEKLVENEYITQYGGGVGFLNKRDQKIMDLLLVDAMTESLQKVGVDVVEQVNTLRRTEHGVNDNNLELTQSFYSSSAYDIYPGRTPGYYQSRDVESQFYLIANTNDSIDLKLSYRTPRRNGASDKVKIYANHVLLTELSTTENWSTVKLNVTPDHLLDGLNIIKINWSTNFGFKANTKELDLCEDYILNKLFNVYGEISSFSAKIK